MANQPWELDPRLGISELAAANLKERYPVISGPQDLSKILVSAGLKVPTTALFAELENGRWMIRGQQAPTVEAVHFNSAPISLLPKLRILASNWIGLVHTDVLQIKIERDIEDFLIKRGYPEAKVSSTMKIDDLKVEYSMNLDIGSPCIIRGFKWPEALPKGFYPKLDLGELCDDSLVIANLEEISKKLHESGWTQSSLAFENFDFSSNRTSALAVVKGTFGENIEYQFIDQATNKIGSYLLTSEELQLLNPRQTSPDAVTYELMTQLKTRGYIDAQVTGPEVSHLNGVAVHKFTVNRGAQYN
ncbi:MAG: hypothetical protein NT027_02045, partial [Proteobacteria bacterium]|nr:hypothetical protein [Pseudomonadota bacterium]